MIPGMSPFITGVLLLCNCGFCKHELWFLRVRGIHWLWARLSDPPLFSIWKLLLFTVSTNMKCGLIIEHYKARKVSHFLWGMRIIYIGFLEPLNKDTFECKIPWKCCICLEYEKSNFHPREQNRNHLADVISHLFLVRFPMIISSFFSKCKGRIFLPWLLSAY